MEFNFQMTIKWEPDLISVVNFLVYEDIKFSYNGNCVLTMTFEDSMDRGFDHTLNWLLQELRALKLDRVIEVEDNSSNGSIEKYDEWGGKIG